MHVEISENVDTHTWSYLICRRRRLDLWRVAHKQGFSTRGACVNAANAVAFSLSVKVASADTNR